MAIYRLKRRLFAALPVTPTKGILNIFGNAKSFLSNSVSASKWGNIAEKSAEAGRKALSQAATGRADAYKAVANDAGAKLAKGALAYGGIGLGTYGAYKAIKGTNDIVTGNLGKENGEGY